MNNTVSVNLNTATKYLFSTSGSFSSIANYNAAFAKLGLNLVYHSFADAIAPDVYAGLLRAPVSLGGAVTGKGGLKSTIIPFLDEVDPLATACLAVNTVVNRGGRLYGYNTDAFGLTTALKRGINAFDLKPSTAVIYGNGGVSGVAFRVLQELGIRVTIVGRNAEQVMKKRRELGIADIPHFEGPYDLLVDATPISSSSDFLEAYGYRELLDGCQAVFCHNMPEKDGKTNFLLDYCKANHIPYITGKWMHSAQLIKQYALFFDALALPSPITEQDIIDTWKLDIE